MIAWWVQVDFETFELISQTIQMQNFSWVWPLILKILVFEQKMAHLAPSSPTDIYQYLLTGTVYSVFFDQPWKLEAC